MEELKKKIEVLEKQVAELIQSRKEYNVKIATITDSRIVLIDSLNENDKYALTIKSGNIDIEKVGD